MQYIQTRDDDLIDMGAVIEAAKGGGAMILGHQQSMMPIGLSDD